MSGFSMLLLQIYVLYSGKTRDLLKQFSLVSRESDKYCMHYEIQVISLLKGQGVYEAAVGAPE